MTEMTHLDAVTTQPAPPTRLHHLLQHWVRLQPEAPALQDAALRLNYLQLDQACLQAADQLQSLGVRAGDRVLIVAENCAALGVLVLALSRLNAWCTIANARLSEREIDVFIAHAEPRRVLYTAHVSQDAAKHAQRHGALTMHWPGVGELQVGTLLASNQPEPVSPDPREQVAALIYTSGTSGAPKGVMLTHANILFTATAARDLRGLVPGDVSYCLLPMAHIVGLASQFMGCIAAGACVVFEPRFTPAAAVSALAQARITAFVGVPAVFARLLEWVRDTGTPIQAPQLRLISVAGSPLTPTLKADVEALFGLPLHNGYGLTECAPTVAQTRIDSPRSDCAVGPAIPGVALRLVTAIGQDTANGEVGELWVRSPGLMKGYYRNPQATAEAINAQGWFNTGDMARLDPDGALSIVGRSKELIIRSGLNVYPVEVEQAINSHPDVVQSAVVGRTAGDNEDVVAYVEARASSTLTAPELTRHLRQHLAPYKVPGEIRFMTPLPAAPTGKVLKNVLKAMAQRAPEPAPEPETRCTA